MRNTPRGLNRDTVERQATRAEADRLEARGGDLFDSGTSAGASHGRRGNADHEPAEAQAVGPRRAPTPRLPGESASAGGRVSRGAPEVQRPALSGCRCEQCSPGDPAPTYTEAHRHACEVRYVANMPSNEDRAAYLDGVQSHRGHEAYQRLRRDAWTALQALSASRARALEPA